MKKDNKKPIFFCGLGEQPSKYKFLSKVFDLVSIDWNKIKIPKYERNIVVGFSMGAILACEYSLKHKVKTLILCSITPGAESLSKVKADKIFFLAGEKEKWVLKDIKRIFKTVKKRATILVVPKADHKIDGNYFREIKKLLN